MTSSSSAALRSESTAVALTNRSWCEAVFVIPRSCSPSEVAALINTFAEFAPAAHSAAMFYAMHGVCDGESSVAQRTAAHRFAHVRARRHKSHTSSCGHKLNQKQNYLTAIPMAPDWVTPTMLPMRAKMPWRGGNKKRVAPKIQFGSPLRVQARAHCELMSLPIQSGAR
jgi:hypothetical protein